jgi:hypothetical protein
MKSIPCFLALAQLLGSSNWDLGADLRARLPACASSADRARHRRPHIVPGAALSYMPQLGDGPLTGEALHCGWLPHVGRGR